MDKISEENESDFLNVSSSISNKNETNENNNETNENFFVQSELDALKERDFIWADLKSIIYTNQKDFINLPVLMKEYVNPLMKTYNITPEKQKVFVENLCNNILIQDYLTYDELFFKLLDLNSQIMEHKINNIGLIIVINKV